MAKAVGNVDAITIYEAIKLEKSHAIQKADNVFCTIKYEKDNTKMLKAEIEKLTPEIERLVCKYEHVLRNGQYDKKTVI